MKLTRRNKMEEEFLIYKGHPAWRAKIFLLATFIAIFLMSCFAYLGGQELWPFLKPIALELHKANIISFKTISGWLVFFSHIGFGISGVLFLKLYVHRIYRTYTLSSHYIEQVVGIFQRNPITSMITREVNVELRQSFWQRLLNYGDIIFSTYSGEDDDIEFRNVVSPGKVKKMFIEQQISIAQRMSK